MDHLNSFPYTALHAYLNEGQLKMLFDVLERSLLGNYLALISSSVCQTLSLLSVAWRSVGLPASLFLSSCAARTLHYIIGVGNIRWTAATKKVDGKDKVWWPEAKPDLAHVNSF